MEFYAGRQDAFARVGGGDLRALARGGELRFGAEVEFTSASCACDVTSEDDATAATTGDADLTAV